MIHLFLKERMAHLLFTQKDEKSAMSLYTHIWNSVVCQTICGIPCGISIYSAK